MSRRGFFLAITVSFLISQPSFLLAQHEHHLTPTTIFSSKKAPSKTIQIKENQDKKQDLNSTPLPVKHSKKHIINLVVSYKTVNFAGRPRRAIAVNNQIPAPTLHFKEGDQVTINVHNHLDKGTAIHWHGLLVPWQMDGVEGVSQREIPPGRSFRYQFTLEQSGTYWYHAHAGLQEQEGLYGAFLIDPSHPTKFQYNWWRC